MQCELFTVSTEGTMNHCLAHFVLSVSNVYVYDIGLVMYKYHYGLLPHIPHIFEK